MFIKTAMVVSAAIILGSASGAVAQSQYNIDTETVSGLASDQSSAMRAQASATVGRSRNATSARARANSKPAGLSSHLVIDNGRVVGRDPDPLVRDQILRDWRYTLGY